MATNNDPLLGSWEGADFGATVSQHNGVGAHDDVPEQARFLAGVVRLLLRRKAELELSDESESCDIAIFVLKSGEAHKFVPNAVREPMIDNGLTKIVGLVWFTAAPVVSAHFVEFPEASNDDDRFSYVANDLELGSLPALVFDPRPRIPQLRWYPEGLSVPDAVEEKPIEGAVTPEEVFAAIDAMHSQCLVTPTSMPPGFNLWENTLRYWVRKDAEALVQSYLKAGLVMRFPFCTVRHEQPQTPGRSDLEIEQPTGGGVGTITRYAVLELKVLRSFGSTGIAQSAGENNEWIEKGVDQAAAYRRDKGSHWSALCCFDMRNEDDGHDASFSHVVVKADTLDVNLWRWYLYSSSERFRDATINN